MTFESHEAYVQSMPPEVRPLLLAIRDEVVSRLPEASPCISYQLPAFRAGRVFFYFAAFRRHIGVYPPVTQDTALVQELAPYRGPKGNLSFPLDRPLPIDLIGRVALALYREYGSR